MTTYVIRRILQLVPVLLLVTLMIFMIMHLLPGDPVQLMLMGAEGGAVPPQRLAEMRQALGLDKPLWIQYLSFLAGAVTGNFGESIRFRSPVAGIIANRLPHTIALSVAGMAIAVIIGLSLGTVAAVWKNTWIDTFSMVISFVGVSMPIFWLGLLLILFFSIDLNWLPPTGTGGLPGLVLPAFTLGLVSAALISRLTRSSLLEVMDEDFVRTARSKGLTGWAILVRHVARNALIPVITIVGLQFGNMLAGTVVTETVFSRPGLGRLVVNAILWKDYPLVQGSILVLATIYVAVNLLVDLSYVWIDPRIEYL